MSSNHRSMLNENEPFSISRESFESYRRSFVREAFSYSFSKIVSNRTLHRTSPPAHQSTHMNLPPRGKVLTRQCPTRHVPRSNLIPFRDPNQQLRTKKASRTWDSTMKESSHRRRRAYSRALGTTLRRHQRGMFLDQIRVIGAFISQEGSVGRVWVKVPS